MRRGDAQKHLDRFNEWFGFQPESPEVLYGSEVTGLRLAQILKVNPASIGNWARAGELVESRLLGRERIYLLRDVLRQLECLAQGLPNPLLRTIVGAVDRVKEPEVMAPLQAMRERIAAQMPAPSEPPPSDPFEAVRARAAKAAKEAFRDVILEAADAAEERGEKDLQIRFLKEFIFAEESVAIFVGRSS
jgi:hypothetical protein